jgi:hypothetical protein
MTIIKGFKDWSGQIYESRLNPSLWYLNEGLEQEAGVGESQGKLDPSKAHPSLGWDPDVIAKVEAMSDSDVLKKTENIIILCRIKIFERLEWFKPYWDVMPPVPAFLAGSRLSNKIGTMDTNGSSIRYCPRFVMYTFEFARKHMKGVTTKGSPWQIMRNGEKWFNDYATFVIIHEIMHNSLKHFLRTRQQNVVSKYLSPNEIHRLWNLAQDYEINRIIKSMLGDMVEIFPGGVDHEAGGFKAPNGEEDFFGTSSSERIFYRLLRNIEAARAGKKASDPMTPPQPQPNKNIPLSPGDIVELKSKPGEYGKVVSVTGDENDPDDMDVEITPITKEEAMQKTSGGQDIIQIADIDEPGSDLTNSSEWDDLLKGMDI